MKRPQEIVRLGDEIRSRLTLLGSPSTSAVRAIRREFSRRIANAKADSVVQLALYLLESNSSDLLRFFAYEMVSKHKLASKELATDDLLNLGKGLCSWSSVDCFAIYLSGPMWAQGRLSDKIILTWARSEDRWWRRAALVSTVALSRRGNPDDVPRVAKVCTLLATDRDDMVVKALSWALREIAKKHPEQARTFVTIQKSTLAARVIREVNNKLDTGLKTPGNSARNTVRPVQASRLIEMKGGA